MENITHIEIVIAAISFLIGLLLGGMIWGGQRRHIRDLEDELELCRVRAGQQLVNAQGEPELGAGSDVETVIGPDMPEQAFDPSRISMHNPDEIPKAMMNETVQAGTKEDGSDWLKVRARQIEEKPNASDASKINRKEVIKELSTEIEEMRKILDGDPIDVDVLKEYLDVTDVSVKIANDRLDQVLEAFHKRAKVRAHARDHDLDSE